MSDEPKREKSQAQVEDEAPAIYSLGHVDGNPTFKRRSFLEIAAVAAGTAALPSCLGGQQFPSRGLARGKRGSAARAHEEAITALAVNAAGNLLASGDKGGALRLWQLPEGVLLRSWSGYTSEVTGLYFVHSDNAQSSSKGEVLWSAGAGAPLKQWRLLDSSKIAQQGRPHLTLRYWGSSDADERQDGRTMGGRTGGEVMAAPTTGNWYVVRTNGLALDLRSPTTGETLASLSFPDDRVTSSDDRVTAVAATSDGRLLIAGTAEGNLGLWTTLASRTAPDGGARPAEARPVGADVQTLKMGTSRVSALAVDPRGTLAVSAEVDGHLRTWALPGLTAGETFQSSFGKPLSVAVRPQLDLFVAGLEESPIGLWRRDQPTSSPQVLEGHTAPVRATVITPDGSLLISGSDDKTIRLWSLPDGKYLGSLVDLAVNYDNVKGTTYKGTDAYGRTISYTLPCGSPIPPGAVCVCNCVPGAMAIPKHHSSRYDSAGYCTCDLICTCNTVCTCQSVGGGGYSISYWYPN
jgi:WD40 repeat protein